MNRMKNHQASASGGFTLIEILVVLILISLILGISSVYFAGTLPKAKYRAAASEMAATIKYARSLAMSRNERQVVTFDLDAGHYGIEGRITKTIPEETSLVIYSADLNADPILKGRFRMYYDATGVSNWDQIGLIRKNRIIRIDADPLLTAVMGDEEQDE